MKPIVVAVVLLMASAALGISLPVLLTILSGQPVALVEEMPSSTPFATMTPTALAMLAQLPTLGPVGADSTHAPVATAAMPTPTLVATAAMPTPTRVPTKDRASPSPTAETIPTVVGGV
jgi:hypothetical protein